MRVLSWDGVCAPARWPGTTHNRRSEDEGRAVRSLFLRARLGLGLLLCADDDRKGRRMLYLFARRTEICCRELMRNRISGRVACAGRRRRDVSNGSSVFARV